MMSKKIACHAWCQGVSVQVWSSESMWYIITSEEAVRLVDLCQEHVVEHTYSLNTNFLALGSVS